jgi:chorismate-pyruvate lyase
MNGPTIEELLALFPGPDASVAYRIIPGDEMPESYRGLLVHEHHMTVTVEAFYGSPVEVRVLQRQYHHPFYARKIQLVLPATGRVVLFGIPRINLDFTSPEVREAILAANTPLGRILIEHDVLRRIEPTAYLRIDPGPEQMAWFGLSEPTPLYGRLAIIHCDDKPAVELLEVVAPE